MLSKTLQTSKYLHISFLYLFMASRKLSQSLKIPNLVPLNYQQRTQKPLAPTEGAQKVILLNPNAEGLFLNHPNLQVGTPVGVVTRTSSFFFYICPPHKCHSWLLRRGSSCILMGTWPYVYVVGLAKLNRLKLDAL